ncbi:DNA adenine methylase [PVC group bacterium]|nr:DNA adenine methylase [PVC group bacterium]
MMGRHSAYIETHLGSGAIMKRKLPTVNNIGIDLDSEALSNFECSYPVELINGCAHDFLKTYDFSGTELIYCDPPYLIETRTSNRTYRFDYTEQDHIDLVEILKSLPCQIILSGYPSALYDDLVEDWNVIELQAMSNGGPRTEKLWFNYEIERCFWSTYAGKDKTDRQRIKRKAQRWKRNYQKLPSGERLAIMTSLMEAEGSLLKEEINKRVQ